MLQLLALLALPEVNCGKELQIVISRYNEDLEWLNVEPFTADRYVIYNKGPYSIECPQGTNCYVESLPNVGREGHAYLHHIIKNFDNLADVTVFLPGWGSLNSLYYL